MASLIEAVIFAGDGPAPVPSGVSGVRLTAEWTMLPVTEELLEQLDPASAGDDWIPSGWALRQPVAALARSISLGRTALYIVSETFGGPGITEAIAWTDGQLVYGPSGTCAGHRLGINRAQGILHDVTAEHDDMVAGPGPA